MRTRLAGLLITVFCGVACEADGPLGGSSGADLLGSWGGEHASLSVTEGGGRLEFDCAVGVLDGPLRPDPGGAFEVAGDYILEGGPVLPGQPPAAMRRARYRGTVTGDAMELRVTLVEGDREIGSFRLRRGAAPVLDKCL